MKILYDHQAFTNQLWGGVSKCFCELIKNRPPEMNYSISIKECDNHHLIESGLATDTIPMSRNFFQFHKKHEHSILGRQKIYNFLSNYGIIHTAENVNKKHSIKKLKEGQFDIFHPTFFDTYFFPYLQKKPYVLTIHDLMPELFGWYKGDPQIKNKPILCNNAAAIITVSEKTKEDLCKLYRLDDNKIHVVYHGGPDISRSDYSTRNKIIDKPYFLYVGRRYGYKNFYQTLIDFSKFHSIHPEVVLICTGLDFSDKERQDISKLKLSDSVIHIFASDEDMAALYQHSIAFIFPSLYEGFGMPILEAFSNGCPVLLNNKSCFPEIGGDAALYFESEQGESNLPIIMDSIYNANQTTRKELIEAGFLRLQHFSWKKSAKKLFDIYNSII